MTVKLIVGLGNPGSRYEDTRHNAGFWLVDVLAARHGGTFRAENKFHGDACAVQIGAYSVRLLKPQTYMNESGRALQAMSAFFKIGLDEVLVAHDEIDLPPGTVRIKRGGGHGGHNGLRDIIPQLGGPGFARLRIGVGHPGHKDQVIGYVLSRAGKEESKLIDESVDRAARAFDDMVRHGLDRVMNELHRREA